MTDLARYAATGGVDFVMMYAAHDAFNRDLARLADAARTKAADDPALLATWTMFTRQLHLHHATEDATLWPMVRSCIVDPREAAILDAMEAEHATLDPLIASVDEAVRLTDPDALRAGLSRLGTGLSAHMRHEETEALPLIERRIGQEGWDGFAQGIRRAQGLRGIAVYLPWVLDDAAETVRAAVLGVLPPPARLVYRLRWEPRHRRAVHL